MFGTHCFDEPNWEEFNKRLDRSDVLLALEINVQKGYEYIDQHVTINPETMRAEGWIPCNWEQKIKALENVLFVWKQKCTNYKKEPETFIGKYGRANYEFKKQFQSEMLIACYNLWKFYKSGKRDKERGVLCFPFPPLCLADVKEGCHTVLMKVNPRYGTKYSFFEVPEYIKEFAEKLESITIKEEQ